MEALEQAAYEVDVYDNHLDVLLSMHKECGDGIKWRQLLSKPEPKTPLRSDTLEHAATRAVEGYRPNFWSRIFKLEARQRAALLTKVEGARTQDLSRFHAELKEWKPLTLM